MARTITIATRTTKKEGSLYLRFRLRDGRDVQLFRKSNIKVTIPELNKLTPEGKIRSHVSIFNKEIVESIDKELRAMQVVYSRAKDSGEALTSEKFDKLVDEELLPEKYEDKTSKILLPRFKTFIEEGKRNGVFGEGRTKHYIVSYGELERFLTIKGLRAIQVEDFSPELLLDFREFLADEYLLVPKWTGLYTKMKEGNVPTERRANNTIVTKLKLLGAFFNDLKDREEISNNPFKKIGKKTRSSIMKTKYSDPFFLTREEFLTILEKSVPERLQETKEAFLLQCALGCRVGDFQSLTMKNVSVSSEGIPFVHYLPQKTKELQKDNKEIETPLLRFAFDIIKRRGLDFTILNYVYGENGYNKKIKELLKYCGIDREVAVLQDNGENEYRPIYEEASSKLCRKTLVNMMSSVQVNLYLSGLHKEGSEAVHRYTQPTMKERFVLMSLAFDQDLYKVDSNLNVLEYGE